MAAPSSTQWGSIRGSGTKQSRIGINVTYSDSATSRTVTIAIWYWTRYRVQDSSNMFRYGWSSSANTNIGTKSINTTSNSSWSTTNQVLIGTYSKVYTKGTSASTGTASAAFDNIEYGGGTGWIVINFSIPALASYTVSYNANSGSGAPSSQTKWYGKNINLSTARPTRTGCSFQGWATSVSGGVVYAPGAVYSGNASITLYAVWKANTYTVSYNANGGTGAPSSQIKTYGINLTLSSTKPTRTNYNFKGWGTSSSSTTVTYAAGATYSANSSVTLYAIWELAYTEPRITNFSVDRCDSSGTISEEGTYALVKFNWATDKTVSSIKIKHKISTSSTWTTTTVTGSGVSGAVNRVIGDGSLSIDYEYNVQVEVIDANGNHNEQLNVAPIAYIIDLLAGGGGIAFGKPSTKKGFEVAMKSTFENEMYDRFGTKINNGLASNNQFTVDPDTTLEELIVTKNKTPSGSAMYIRTVFYGSKTTSSNRSQTASPYYSSGSIYHRYFSGGVWSSWRRQVNEDEVSGLPLKTEHFLTLENHTSVITLGNLRGGTLNNIHGVKYGKVVTLYMQINNITSGGSDVQILKFKDSKYYPAMYAVHNAFISKENNICYIGQFNDGHFTMAINGSGTINTSSKAMVLFTITYITA